MVYSVHCGPSVSVHLESVYTHTWCKVYTVGPMSLYSLCTPTVNIHIMPGSVDCVLLYAGQFSLVMSMIYEFLIHGMSSVSMFTTLNTDFAFAKLHNTYC